MQVCSIEINDIYSVSYRIFCYGREMCIEKFPHKGASGMPNRIVTSEIYKKFVLTNSNLEVSVELLRL